MMKRRHGLFPMPFERRPYSRRCEMREVPCSLDTTRRCHGAVDCSLEYRVMPTLFLSIS